ncbi:MAG: FG-GAP repeat domain-containing protein [Candidatus Methylomirabilales bacterium]
MKATSTKLAISLFLLGLVTASAQAETASSVSTATDQVARQMAEAFKPLWGTVLSALPDHRFILDVTAENGVFVGMEMEVFREGEPFKHPGTGQVLGRMDKKVGVVRVVEVKEKFSVAEKIFLDEGEEIKQGDGVRVTAARVQVGLANVSSSMIAEGQARVLNREIETALLKTGRFEVMDERVMRTTLEKEQVADSVPLTDPKALGTLRSTLRLHAVIVPIVRAIEQGLGVELKAVSTFSSRPIYLASTEVRTATASAPNATETQQAAAAPPTAAAAASTVPSGMPAPAWLGPPGKHSPDHFLAVPYAGVPSARLVLGPAFDSSVRAIAVADMNGDGVKDLAVAEKSRIHIYAVKGKAFKYLWSSKGQSLEGWSNILAMDAADINGNGVAEIFVTSFFGDEVNSYVLELQKEEWVPIWQQVDLYFRVLPNGQGEPVLYAQTYGNDKAFAGKIHAYGWRDGGYQRQAALKLPRGTDIYSFAVGDVKNDGSKQVLQINNDSHRLRLYNGAKILSEPTEKFGGTGVTFDFHAEDYRNVNVGSDSDIPFTRHYVHPPLLIVDVNGDGTRDLVAVRNSPSLGGIMKYATVYDKGKIVALKWSPLGLQILWETPDLEGYIPDLFFGDLGDGGERVLIFPLVKAQKLGLAGGHSGVFVYRIPAAPAETHTARGPEGVRLLK